MTEAPDTKLSPSEKRTLQHVAEGELGVTELDWVALQRLKKLGLLEDKGGQPRITKEGRRVLRVLAAS